MSVPINPPASRYAIALGGNTGPVARTFQFALDDLASTPGVHLEQVSRFHATRPVGTPSDREFLNAAALVTTTLPPDSLLERLHEIEARYGRTRQQRWDDRPLDLDLILRESLPSPDTALLSSQRVLLPHPQYPLRRFVLDPLAEIAPHWRDPHLGFTIAELRDRLLVRPLHLGLIWPDPLAHALMLTRSLTSGVHWTVVASLPFTTLSSPRPPLPPAWIFDARVPTWDSAEPSAQAPFTLADGVPLLRVARSQTTVPTGPLDARWLEQRLRELVAAAVPEAG